MRKFLKITLVFAILLFCAVSVVNAATNQDLLAYVSKTFDIAGEKVTLNSEYRRVAERFLNAHPVTDEQAAQIIAKIDAGVKLMNDAGVSDYTKLSKAQKDQLVSMAKEAAQIAGATVSIDAEGNATILYNGVVFDKVSVKADKALVQTGSDYSFVVYAIAGVAIVAVAAVAITRKNKVNA